MKEPKAKLDIILNDPYATRASKDAACKLYNMCRRQVTRRKRAVERLAQLEQRIKQLENLQND